MARRAQYPYLRTTIWAREGVRVCGGGWGGGGGGGGGGSEASVVANAPYSVLRARAPFRFGEGEWVASACGYTHTQPRQSDLLRSLSEYYAEEEIPEDTHEDPRSLLGQVDLQMKEIQVALHPGICRGKIGCALTAILFFDKSISESRNELLVCKLFTMISRGEYRAHCESTDYLYSNGSWSSIHSIPYPALEYATSRIRAADGCFRLLASPKPNMPRSKEAFFPFISEVVSSMDMAAILSLLPQGRRPLAAGWLNLRSSVSPCSRISLTPGWEKWPSLIS